MSPETEAFLASVRDLEDPSPEDAERVLLAVKRAAAAGVLVSVGSNASDLCGWGLSGLKAAALMCCVVLTAVAPSGIEQARIEQARIERAPSKRRIPVVPVPALPLAEPTRVAVAVPPDSVADAAERSTRPEANSRRIRSHSPEAQAPSLRDELAQLAQVQGALQRGDGAAALLLLNDATTAAGTQLVAERETARILALCALGRDEEARLRAVGFRHRHPGSIQLMALERSCAETEDPADFSTEPR
jgi:hypothetical protein